MSELTGHFAEPFASQELALEHGMTTDEHGRLLEILGRPPTVTELGMYSVMWSEHCSYKSSRVHLKTLPTDGKAVLHGPGENAGVVDLGGGYAGVFKVESHNHPSYIEPYQGAATGVGGILRDVFTMGARPLALLDSLRFGTLDKPRNRFLIDGVVGGIAGYGNCIGVPTVGGEVYFDPSYDYNPLVNVMCFGIVRSDRLVLARAGEAGDPVIYVGAKTGRDGIYGVSLLASATFDSGAEDKRPAVQVGDPFTEKLLMESCLELVDRNLIVGMQDMGGAGLTCATCEMSSKSGLGMEIDVAMVPTRETGMTPYEVMLSESQERMLLVCRRELLDDVRQVFEKWDLHAIEIGTVIEENLVRVFADGALVAEVPADSLAEQGPCYERPYELALPPLELQPQDLPSSFDLVPAIGGTSTNESILLSLLADPSISSKRWIFQQYDQTVRTNTMQRPGGDAAVIRIKETGGAVALALDGNPWFTGLYARDGAALAVAEACRNVACTGARPLAITNCLNFGSPEVPSTMGQFADAVAGMGEACRALGVPVTGGNVSFYNETDGTPILPTAVVGALGSLKSAKDSVPAAFRRASDRVVLLGVLPDRMPGQEGGPLDWGLGGSALLRVARSDLGGRPPSIDLEREAALQRLLVAAADRGLLSSAHDCSDGGLALSLAEACFGQADEERTDAVQAGGAAPEIGEVGGRLGAFIELGATEGRTDLRLFGEASSRVVVSVSPDRVNELVDLAAAKGVACGVIGEVTGEAGEPPRLVVGCGAEPVLDIEVAFLYEAWAGSLQAALNRVG